MSDELTNITLAANEMAREIMRLRGDNRAAHESRRILQEQINAQAEEIDSLRTRLSTAQTDLAAGRAKMLRDIAVDMVSGRLDVVWDETICAKVLEQGPFAFAAYAQIHIAESLRRKAEADTN